MRITEAQIRRQVRQILSESIIPEPLNLSKFEPSLVSAMRRDELLTFPGDENELRSTMAVIRAIETVVRSRCGLDIDQHRDLLMTPIGVQGKAASAIQSRALEDGDPGLLNDDGEGWTDAYVEELNRNVLDDEPVALKEAARAIVRNIVSVARYACTRDLVAVGEGPTDEEIRDLFIRKCSVTFDGDMDLKDMIETIKAYS
jgi:hypothetical protein